MWFKLRWFLLNVRIHMNLALFWEVETQYGYVALYQHSQNEFVTKTHDRYSSSSIFVSFCFCDIRTKSLLTSGDELIIWNNVRKNNVMSVSDGHYIVLEDINSK